MHFVSAIFLWLIFGTVPAHAAGLTPKYCRVDVVSDAWFFYGLLEAKQIPDGDRASEPRRLRAYVKELFRTVNAIYRRNEVPVQFTVGDLMRTPSICTINENSSHHNRLLRDFTKIYAPKKNECLMLYLTFRPLHQVQEDGRKQISMGISPVPHPQNGWDLGICATGLLDNEKYENIYKNYVLVSATDVERIPVIEALSTYDIAHGIAHEFGHSLSALNECICLVNEGAAYQLVGRTLRRKLPFSATRTITVPTVDGFLMTASGYKKTERRSANSDFSPCAKQAVLSHLRRVEQSGKSCLTSKSHQDEWDKEFAEDDAERQESLQWKAEL